MKKILMSTMFALLFIARAAFADSATYTPPPETGDIYIVIKYVQTILNTDTDTQVTVNWGAYNHTATISPPWFPKGECNTPGVCGFIIKLKHKKADDITMTVTTNGQIMEPPMQGSAPPHPNYEMHNW